ncbi:MAG: hypothetical protein AB7U20_08865 [Planctomycetaceae bacterium]
MIALAPERIICLDTAFGGNDQLKTNTVIEMKSHKIEIRTVQSQQSQHCRLSDRFPSG